MADREGNIETFEDGDLTKLRTKEISESSMKVKDNSSKNESDSIPSLKDVLTVLSELKENKDSDISSQIDTVQRILERLDTDSKQSVIHPQKESADVLETLSVKRNEEKLNVVMAEYEKAISKLVRDNACILKERDTFQVHLANVEAAFSDVHQKYERCKGIIEGFKNNETILKETIRANEEQILKQNNKYEALKTHAMGQLEKANNELLEIKKNYDDEIIRLKATIQKLELQNSSLKQTVDQRTKECQELTRICDDLITKVGR